MIPEVCVAFAVLVRVAFPGLRRRLGRFFHRLIPETHVGIVGVAPNAAGV